MSNTTLLNTHKKKIVFDKTTCKYHHLLLLSTRSKMDTLPVIERIKEKEKKQTKKKEYRTSLGSVRQAVCLHKPKRRRRGAKDGVHARTNLRNKTRESGRSFSG